jgi:hypothetical protein
MKKFLFLSAILNLFILGCSPVDSAGVITETESGKSIAGVVTDSQGIPLANVRVALIDTHYISARPLFKKEVFSNDSGQFVIDSIPEGSYRLSLIDSSKDRSLLTSVELAKDDSLETIQVKGLKLLKNGAFNLDLSLFNLSAGDTLCLTGSLYCKIINSHDDSIGHAKVNSITATSYKKINVLKTNHSSEQFQIQWKLESEKILFVTEQGNYFSKSTITKTFSESLKEGNYSGDSIPMRFVLSNTWEKPMLLDTNGNTILLQPISTQDDSIVYFGIVPKVDFSKSTTLSFAVIDSAQNGSLNTPPVRSFHYFNESLTNSTTITEPVFQDSAIGLSFRFKIDGKDQDTLGVVLISARTAEGKGFDIRQRESTDSVSICVRLYSDTLNNVIAASDTIIYGAAKLLDNEWHHYTLFINKAHLTISADGEIIRNTDIKVTENFYNPSEIIIGSDPLFRGSLTELFILDGKKDTSWIKTQYELQKR